MRRLLISLLMCSVPVGAQVAHPRIWLDSTTMTRLTALKNANDATWANLKASADTFATRTVEAYDRNACTGSDICYSYEGLGWLEPVEELSLAYQMTGSTTYSNKVKQILNSMAAAGSTPCSVDVGFPSRSAVLALAIGYDWIYPTLSAGDKTNYTAELDACWTWLQASGYYWVAPSGAGPNGYSNYFGGHMVGYGLAAIAVEGDDSNSASMQSTILSNFTTYVVPAFTTIGGGGDGGFKGGYAEEGYNYGGNHFLRLFQYMRGMTTAGKTDLFNTDITYIKAVAKNLLYEIRPDLWSVTNEGDFSGTWAHVFYFNIPYDLGGLLNGTTEGGWMEQLYANQLPTPPADSVPASIIEPGLFELFLYNQGQTAIDYTATQPVYYFSPGDNHTITRTNWTTSAVHTTFNGGAVGPAAWPGYADHPTLTAGNVSINRGSDYLLINAGMWNGADGVSGSPSAEDQGNWHFNTLYYYDGGTDCIVPSGGRYYGCQMFWSITPNTVKHNEGTGFTFLQAPISGAYVNNAGPPGLTTITAYTRTMVNINDVSFVFDRISAPSTSTRKIEWHFPSLTSDTPAGIASANSLSGVRGTVTVGSSKLWIDILLPVSATITKITDETSMLSGTNMTTQRFEVVDPAAGSCTNNCLFLTVLAPTASGASAPTVTLLTPTNYKGVLYDDGATPRIAIFSLDGTTHNAVTYTASYSSSLSGRHVITDLTAGTYSVIRDSVLILTGLTVASDGSLSFTATGGTSFNIGQSQGTVGSGTVPGTTLNLGVTVR